jgi:hypothetical protein
MERQSFDSIFRTSILQDFDMPTTQFPRPVTVLVGLGFPRRIASALDAYALLTGISGLAHDEAFEATITTCQLAMVGTVSADEANDVFTAYTRRTGLFFEEWPIEMFDTCPGDIAA